MRKILITSWKVYWGNWHKPLICNSMTGKNPPKSLISLLTPEASLAVFLSAVLAEARSSVLDKPAIASSVKPFCFSEE